MLKEAQWGPQKYGNICGGSTNWRVKLTPTVPSDAFQVPFATQGMPLVVVWPVMVWGTQRTWSCCSITSREGWKLKSALLTVEMATRGAAMSTPGSTARSGPAGESSASAPRTNDLRG